METIAILAAYNLEDSIASIVEKTKEYVDRVIVVSDGSNDNTYQKAKDAGAICPNHTLTRGKGFAVRKGINFSKQFSPKYVVLMDADGQHLPEEIPALLEPLYQKNFDMVVGSRMKGQLKTVSINKMGNFFLKLISFVVTFRWFTDTESGFKAFKAESLYGLNLESISYEIEGELLLKALHNKFRIIEVPITVPKIVPGVTVRDGLKMGLYKLKTGLKLKIMRD